MGPEVQEVGVYVKEAPYLLMILSIIRGPWDVAVPKVN